MFSYQYFATNNLKSSAIILIDNYYYGVDDGYSYDIGNILRNDVDVVNPSLKMVRNIVSEGLQNYQFDSSVILYTNIHLDFLRSFPKELIREISNRTVNIVMMEPMLRPLIDGVERENRFIENGTIPNDPENFKEILLIEEFRKENNIDINVLSCSYGVKNTTYFDSFLFDASAITKSLNEKVDSLWYRRQQSSYVNLRYKMGSFNGRVRSHRPLFVSVMKGLDDYSDTVLTWLNTETLPVSPFNKSRWNYVIAKGKDKLTTDDPMRFSVHEVPNGTTWDDYETSAWISLPAVMEEYVKCATIMVNETQFFTPYANISEKTFMALGSMRPFILCAPTGSLELVRKLGFQTFSDIWDESYDEITDHKERILAIFELMGEIMSYNRNDLRKKLLKINDVLRHNHDRIMYDHFNKDQIKRFSMLLK